MLKLKKKKIYDKNMTCGKNIHSLWDILEKCNICIFGIFKAAVQRNVTNYNWISVFLIFPKTLQLVVENRQNNNFIKNNILFIAISLFFKWITPQTLIPYTSYLKTVRIDLFTLVFNFLLMIDLFWCYYVFITLETP